MLRVADAIRRMGASDVKMYGSLDGVCAGVFRVASTNSRVCVVSWEDDDWKEVAQIALGRPYGWLSDPKAGVGLTHLLEHVLLDSVWKSKDGDWEGMSTVYGATSARSVVLGCAIGSSSGVGQSALRLREAFRRARVRRSDLKEGVASLEREKLERDSDVLAVERGLGRLVKEGVGWIGDGDVASLPDRELMKEMGFDVDDEEDVWRCLEMLLRERHREVFSTPSHSGMVLLAPGPAEEILPALASIGIRTIGTNSQGEPWWWENTANVDDLNDFYLSVLAAFEDEEAKAFHDHHIQPLPTTPKTNPPTPPLPSPFYTKHPNPFAHLPPASHHKIPTKSTNAIGAILQEPSPLSISILSHAAHNLATTHPDLAIQGTIGIGPGTLPSPAASPATFFGLSTAFSNATKTSTILELFQNTISSLPIPPKSPLPTPHAHQSNLTTPETRADFAHLLADFLVAEKDIQPLFQPQDNNITPKSLQTTLQSWQNAPKIEIYSSA